MMVRTGEPVHSVLTRALLPDNRVRYFRLLGHSTRWIEQFAIVGAEFARTVRHFQRMSDIWARIATDCDAAVMQLDGDVLEARGHIAAEGVVQTWLQEPVTELMKVSVQRGFAAYARKKSSFYRDLAAKTKKQKEEAARRWDVRQEWIAFDSQGIVSSMHLFSAHWCADEISRPVS